MVLCGAADPNLDAAIAARAIVEPGDQARLRHVMIRAQAGEPITVGVIGGSITQGARASAQEKCWGALTADWWRTAFPKSSVTFVNAGIGATASDLGAHRVRRHLLDKKPDVVVVEYAVNDSGNPFTEETLEGLLRQILAEPQQPAVVLFFTLDQNGNNRQAEHERVGRHYGLPMVSLKNALWPEVQAGKIAWTDFEADEVHPNDLGHAYCSQLLAGLFEQVKRDLPKDSALPAIPPVPRPLLSDLFEHTNLYTSETLPPVRNEGWVKGPNDPMFGTGWKTDQPGSELEFAVEGEAISVLFWRIKGPMGRAEAWVDNREPVTLEAWFGADWGGYTPFQLIARDLAPGKHTLKLTVTGEHSERSTGTSVYVDGLRVEME